MKVKELIAMLQKLPQNHEISLERENDSIEITDLYVCKKEPRIEIIATTWNDKFKHLTEYMRHHK